MTKTYRNLSELMDAHGAESPYHLGKLIYKYTDCGPWVSFLLPDWGGGNCVYYKSERANTPLPECVGIKVGTIVEGSDVELEPRILLFPFTDDEWNETVKGLDDEAKFYWERDNSHWFLCRWHGEEYPFRMEDFDDKPKWDVSPPSHVRRKVETWLKEDGNLTEDPNGQFFTQTHPDGEWFAISSRIEVMQYTNDCCYDC